VPLRQCAQNEDLALEASNSLRLETEHRDDLSASELLLRVMRELGARRPLTPRPEIDPQLVRWLSRAGEILDLDSSARVDTEPAALTPLATQAPPLGTQNYRGRPSRPVCPSPYAVGLSPRVATLTRMTREPLPPGNALRFQPYAWSVQKLRRGDLACEPPRFNVQIAAEPPLRRSAAARGTHGSLVA
jgi:hypothetical protein